VTPALRLVVAWMVGVVATLGVVTLAAWRGQLWFHDAHAACPAALPSPPVLESPSSAIRNYLRAHYDEIDDRNGGLTTGLAYDGAPLVEVRNDRIQRALPGTRFFTTKVQRADYEDKQAETLVSFTRGAEHDDIRSLLSPVYGRSSHKFFGQFFGISAPTLGERKEIALGIAELLATITYAGVARPAIRHGRRATAELWYDGLLWRDVEVASNHRGRVNEVVVRNPRDPSDVEFFSDFSIFEAR
jgi:hypothetical protein